MIKIKPFKALRPPRDKAYLVATRSYLSYTDAELDDKLNNNPFTFLHVINSKDLRKLPFGPQKYSMVKGNFERFKQDMIFHEDAKENYYLYRQVKEGNEYIGLIAAVSVEDYFEDRIKKHENTLTNRENMFTDYLEITGFNAEPVLLTYKDDLRLDVIFARYIEQRSEYEFTSTDKVLHQLWLIENEEDIEKITELIGDQHALYIADGHHRSASASLLSRRLSEKGNNSQNHQHFMAFLIGEEQMKVYDFNRLVKGLNGLSKSSFLEKIGNNFLIEPKREKAFKPEKIHEMGMYVDGEWYKLVPKTGSFNPGDTIDHLDTEILSKNILHPVFGVDDLKTDKRIGFLPGTEGLKGLEEKVNSGEYDVAFALFPVTVEQIKKVADENKIMPPKSTYIEPKLRSGLTVYNID